MPSLENSFDFLNKPDVTKTIVLQLFVSEDSVRTLFFKTQYARARRTAARTCRSCCNSVCIIRFKNCQRKLLFIPIMV